MFNFLPAVGRSLHGEMVKFYWMLLPPYVVLLIVLEILKDSGKGPDAQKIIKRAVVSMLLLFSLDLVLDSIAMVSDGIIANFGGIEKLWEVLANRGPDNESMSGKWFNLRETYIYILSVASYIVAYLGYFVANALVHFVWTILYICSPLMILMYVSESTASITKNLYRGFITVAIWRVLWSILGALLLELAKHPQVGNTEDFLTTVIVNLFIGLSMLFIPIFSRSLISDGLQQAASLMATAPAWAATGAIKSNLKKLGKKTWDKTKNGAGFVAAPLVNPIKGRFDVAKNKLAPRLDKMKKSYKNMGLPKEAKELRKKQLRRRYAIKDQKRKRNQKDSARKSRSKSVA